MILKLALFIILGGILGAGMLYFTRRLMKNRTTIPAQSRILNSRWSSAFWIMTGLAIGSVNALLIPDLVTGFETMGILLVLMSIAVIDSIIRKIPNELIAVLLVLKAGAAIIGLNPGSLIPAVIGLAAGFVIFLIPSSLGMAIGWGDIKLAAVAGFCLGIIGLMQASIIMAGVLALYLLYLTITKKGNLKTSVAVGPSLSLGVGVSLLFPLTIAIF